MTPSTRSIGCALSLLIMSQACTHAVAARPAPATTTAPAPVNPEPVSPTETVTATQTRPAREPSRPSSDPLGSYMDEHFLIGAWARDSVVDGNLEALRVPLRELADYRYESVVPGGWMQGVAKLQVAARLTSAAETLEAAASGVAAMARVCGECHVTQGAKLSFAPSAVSKSTPSSDSVESRMLRHFAAAQRMWEGLALPSDATWQAGATALSHAPARTPTKLRTPIPTGFAQALAELRQLGVRATNADTLDERTNVYALVLATCAHCHASNAVFAF